MVVMVVMFVSVADSAPCGSHRHDRPHRHHFCVSKEQRHVKKSCGGQISVEEGAHLGDALVVCSHRACDSHNPSKLARTQWFTRGVVMAWYLKLSAKGSERGGTSVDAAWVPPSAYESAV